MFLLLLCLLPLGFAAAAMPQSNATPGLASLNQSHWVSIFSVPPAPAKDILDFYPYHPPPGFNSTQGVLVNATVRETFRVSHAAPQIRITVTNIYGTEPLNITAMTVAAPSPDLPGSSAIDISSLKNVTFNKDPSVQIPPGADWTSDPIDFPVIPGSELSVSIYSTQGYTGTVTYHLYAMNTAFYTQGDATVEANFTGSIVTNDTSSYYVFAIEGLVPRSTNLIVTVGDSITDGFGSTINANKRYPDLLSNRLISHPSAGDFAVANQGYSGNRVLRDGGLFGDSLLSRLNHDVFGLLGVTHIIFLEGTNDLGYAEPFKQPVSATQLIQGLAQAVEMTHLREIAAIGGTLTPRAIPAGVTAPNGAQILDQTYEDIRQEVNHWIRSSGVFDYVVDFDAAVRNATHPTQMQSALQTGDWLHPSDAGYVAMANAFDLSVFSKLLHPVGNHY